MRRNPMRRSVGTTKHSRRPRDWDRQAWTKRQVCCVCGPQPVWFGPPADACARGVEAHHAGDRFGPDHDGHRANDDTVIPLCDHHHDCLHGSTGAFDGWTKPQKRAWQDAMIARYRERYASFQTIGAFAF
jgi:hypothetical protein